MSFKAQKWAWEQKTKTPLTQLLLFAIAQLEHDEKGHAWCSHQYLADKCRCTRRAIIQNLKYLEDEKYILVARRTKDGIKSTSQYRVNYSRCEPYSQHDVNDIHKGCERGSQGGSERGSHKQITSFNRLNNNKHGQNEFDLFWSQYPKKVKKKDALRIWKRIKPNAEVLIADVMARKENDDNWIRGYVPDPTTYLNGERWNDEIRQPKQDELTEADKYAIRQRRTETIIQEINGNDVGNDVPALPSDVDADERGDRERSLPGLGA